MPKEILIMRHAKSSWEDESLSDIQRPLNPRGLKAAPKMARFLNQQQLLPDLIVSSSAVRARSTAELIAENVNVNELNVEIVDDFYLAPPGIYIEYASRLASQFCRPMFVGHNPGMENLVNTLVDGEWESFPTAAIAHVVFEFDEWSSFAKQPTVRSASVYRPKEIDDFDGYDE